MTQKGNPRIQAAHPLTAAQIAEHCLRNRADAQCAGRAAIHPAAR